MKRAMSLCSLFFFAFGSMSYAVAQRSGSVSFPNTVRIGANSLPAGVYKVRWEEGSSDAQLTLSGNGHRITIPATAAPATGPDQVFEHRDGSGQVVDGFIVKETNFTLKNR
ncbi:MAG TPA: hypothetical protein VMB49_16785 [Acidobacteriaceae bacterium]|nr:hypothetical protein [Acidobacteriaceae bacterium]